MVCASKHAQDVSGGSSEDYEYGFLEVTIQWLRLEQSRETSGVRFATGCSEKSSSCIAREGASENYVLNDKNGVLGDVGDMTYSRTTRGLALWCNQY